MTYVSNDRSYWPNINLDIFVSYWTVAAGVVVVYDWVLTLGQEIELIWRQRWSLMTVLYLIIRYIGIPYSVVIILGFAPFVSLPDAGSRTMLIFFVITFLAVTIPCGVILAIDLKYVVGEELILSGRYMCGYVYEGDAQFLLSMLWMLNTVWEVLALCLSVWVAVKHFRELRRLGPSTGSTIGDCLRVLIRSHVLYFASFVGVSYLQLVELSPEILSSYSVEARVVLDGSLQILLVVQMFVLGPRLILGVREYHAKLVAGSDTEISMNSIVFQELVHVSTSSTV
ncbi:uncharacterized protein HD556DRAFT_1493076 [Suillus plorans]|uniref:DUF6533 domain-containing protein n=1 Tax=Suillus plorans TaxID=116603 RepID=A0A9P7AJ88_9AGAM|nr:uncharacterized protein HD556DRAFT_1493076 [Suillus plorans]KAG1789540.1 hypothetical protein HD556DRAFT_1493076 [Suillus plorans]